MSWKISPVLRIFYPVESDIYSVYKDIIGTAMKLPRVDKGYRHLKRTRHIIGVLLKYGFADLVDRLGISGRLRMGAPLRPKFSPALSAAGRLRLALEELGPTFIKVGQMLSTRSFLIPPAYVAELSKLQDDVRPVPFEDIRALIEKELDGTLEERFVGLCPTPMASASIAQVHRARLRSGEEVVLKVQRPGIARTIAIDMAILKNLAGLMERHIEESRHYEPLAIVEEMRRTLMRELSFTDEALNVDQFGRNFRDVPDVLIPKLYPEHSTDRLLVLEYIEGVKVSDIERLRAMGMDLKRVAHVGTRFILKQIFEDGLFHADPHPGNLFLTADGRIAPVDFGIVGRLDRGLLDEISDMVVAVWRQDVDLLLRVLVNLGALDIEDDSIDLGRELSDLLARYYGLPLSRLDLKTLLSEALDISSRYHLRLPSNLLLLGKTAGTYEDLGRRLDPEYNFFEQVRPYIKKLLWRRLQPERLSYDAARSLRDLYDLFKIVPRELELILRRFRRGRMAIELQHQGIGELKDEVGRSFNRLSLSVIIAALLLASSLIMTLDQGPLRVTGLIGVAVAVALGLILFIFILRSGRF